ncbi:hypothetical protein I532_03895 [Brevibacillus borstelensis AK1]|uniref:Phage protein n=1 Tax=Brevibacillus borstelensis AK1 TaxID=1300222 RepID=M8DML7_9BACL|nr:hypothetical protein [Brevibacillus borstelensis]EMT54717.1 hypothetical protein I532_03895 [Brevibacillus borstelensis AK1]
MAIVPLKQRVTVTPVLRDEDGNPVTDRYDRPITGEPFTLKCRFTQGTKLVRSATGSGGVHGVTAQEVVSVGSFIFDKHPHLGYYDKLTYIDDNGNTLEYRPLNIAVKPWLNGKSLITVVDV